MDWDALVEQAVEANCAGLECLSGIPGTVGGTPVQNVGAYGQEVSETIREVRALDLRSLQMKTLSNADCGFQYRSSIFNDQRSGSATSYCRSRSHCEMAQSRTSAIPICRNSLPGMPASQRLAEVRAAVREIRHRKAMLIVPGDDDARSAGSFFKNPVVPESVCAELSTCLMSRGLQLPSYPAADGFRKLPAAWLVEQAGFAKGYTKGAAGISRKHALAIINRGGATAAEILALKDEIAARVMDMFGIHLVPEPVLVGF